ncbi:MAG: hypothetical protein EZS28_020796 [Streblomastix strix]|uniref:60S ribosomal protein L29 n=1 Tax=Streblomastix strix TaxID=222440 RepID=A0A5J4VM61_9EUKA|nr:MAG: hypothetical protein EZS28_020796 [Streblomastix strix]
MAKAKNHTNHNQNRKAHRNGIKRPHEKKIKSLKFSNPKFLRNLRHAKAKNPLHGIRTVHKTPKQLLKERLAAK